LHSERMQGSIFKYIYLSLFSIAFAYFESAVVIYLRTIFNNIYVLFPLERFSDISLLIIEIGRELASLIILLMVSFLCGKKWWERFGYFIFIFGIWDIFYYFWLKIEVGWPVSISDWDILFLIPIPWIGPVVAPMAVALLMILIGYSMIRLYDRRCIFRPTKLTWILGIAATAMILFSFMYDISATLYGGMPRPYLYWLLISGLTMYIWAYLSSYRGPAV